MAPEMVKYLRALEKENARLKKMAAERVPALLNTLKQHMTTNRIR